MLDDNPLAGLGADEGDALAAVDVIAGAGVAVTRVGVRGRSGDEILPLPRLLEPDSRRVRDGGEDVERLMGLSDSTKAS